MASPKSGCVLEDPTNFPKTEYWAAETSRRTDAFLMKLGWLPEP